MEKPENETLGYLVLDTNDKRVRPKDYAVEVIGSYTDAVAVAERHTQRTGGTHIIYRLTTEAVAAISVEVKREVFE